MSDDLARPYDPFEIVPRYVWVECPMPEYAGFSVKVRANLRNRDRKALLDLFADVDAERKRLAEAASKRLESLKGEGHSNEIMALIEEMSRLQDANTARIPETIAPYVVAWNLQERDTETDDRVDLPPPAEIGTTAFDNVEQPMLDWIVNALVTAYRGGKSLTDSSKTRDESVAPASESSEITSSETPPSNNPDQSQPSPANSRSRSRSTSRT